MKAAVCTAFGGPEVLFVEERAKPSPKAGEVLVRVRATGVNHADLVVIAGKYQMKQEPPFVPGMEIAGEISELGASVADRSIGERVVGLAASGGYAEYVALPATHVFAMPRELDFETAAATFINYTTAFGALLWRASLKAGETCLVLGGAGGVGLASIILAKSMGARVIGAASSPERCAQMTRNGADATIDYTASPLRDRVQELTGKRGADVIVDPVGGEMGSLALRCIAWGGRIVTLGFTGGAPPQYPANVLLVKNVAALGMFFGSYIDSAPALVREAVGEIHRGLVDGSIRRYDIAVHELGALPELLEQIRARRLTGKAVVTMQAE